MIQSEEKEKGQGLLMTDDVKDMIMQRMMASYPNVYGGDKKPSPTPKVDSQGYLAELMKMIEKDRK